MKIKTTPAASSAVMKLRNMKNIIVNPAPWLSPPPSRTSKMNL
jgi:hypothetical protein